MIGLAQPSEYGTPDGMWKDAYWAATKTYEVPPADIAEVLRRHLEVVYPHGRDLHSGPAPVQLKLISAHLAGLFGDLHYSMSAHAELEENMQRLGLTV